MARGTRHLAERSLLQGGWGQLLGFEGTHCLLWLSDEAARQSAKAAQERATPPWQAQNTKCA